MAEVNKGTTSYQCPDCGQPLLDKGLCEICWHLSLPFDFYRKLRAAFDFQKARAEEGNRNWEGLYDVLLDEIEKWQDHYSDAFEEWWKSFLEAEYLRRAIKEQGGASERKNHRQPTPGASRPKR